MGAAYAPSYAGLFLGLWEENYIYSQHNTFLDKIKWYGRYIDDLFLIFTGSEQELIDFHNYINSTNENLRLSLEYSKKEINFLDIKISRDDNGNLHTSIYRKSSDRNTILRADSFHPSSLISNIPYGQFQRLRRLCDSDDDFVQQATDMHHRFTYRGYKKHTLQQAYNKAKTQERRQLFHKNVRQPKPSQIYFTTQYSTNAHKIKHIIQKNWSIVQSDPDLKTLFPHPPAFSFRRAPTLKDKLVRSYLPATPPNKSTWLQRPEGNYKCGHCNHCTNVVKTKTFTDVFSQKTYQIRGFANCNTTYVVYRLECDCGCFYIGRTKRRLKDRLTEHKYAIRTENMDYPMAVHYKKDHHSNPSS